MEDLHNKVCESHSENLTSEAQMTARDMNNNEAIQMLNRCKHEITTLRTTIEYLKPKADAYDNITTILRLFFVQPSGYLSDDITHIIQKRIDELTPKSEANPVRTPTEKQAFDPDPYSPKDITEANKTPDAQPTARGYIDA